MNRLVSLFAASLSLSASAQVVLSDFSNEAQVSLQENGASVVQGAGTQTLTLPLTGVVWYDLPNLDLTGLNAGQQLALTITKAPGNTSNTLAIELYDSNFDPIDGSQFVFDLTTVGVGSFTTLELELPTGVALLGLGSVRQVTITGSSAPTALTVVTLDNLALVPEPATYGIAAGALALGLVILRRRRSA